MKGSKEEFMELREWVVTMTDDVYTDLPPDWRMSFKSEKAYFPDQHNRLYETDSVYRELFSRYRKAKKELDKYTYDERHPGSASEDN